VGAGDRRWKLDFQRRQAIFGRANGFSVIQLGGVEFGNDIVILNLELIIATSHWEAKEILHEKKCTLRPYHSHRGGLLCCRPDALVDGRHRRWW
jgi:hypothetical protein